MTEYTCNLLVQFEKALPKRKYYYLQLKTNHENKTFLELTDYQTINCNKVSYKNSGLACFLNLHCLEANKLNVTSKDFPYLCYFDKKRSQPQKGYWCFKIDKLTSSNPAIFGNDNFYLGISEIKRAEEGEQKQRKTYNNDEIVADFIEYNDPEYELKLAYWRKVDYITSKNRHLAYNRTLYENSVNSKEYQLDHIFSIIEGYKQGIPEEVIGHPGNLQYLTSIENNKKRGNCWITSSELYKRFALWQNNIDSIMQNTLDSQYKNIKRRINEQ